MKSTTRPVLGPTAAQLFVADIDASCAFFKDKLGFAVAFTYGDPPFYAAVKRDQGNLTLRRVCEPVFIGDIRRREELLSASIDIATKREVEQLFLEFESQGATFFQRPKSEPWGARTFIVEDPDGNLILFAGPDQ